MPVDVTIYANDSWELRASKILRLIAVRDDPARVKMLAEVLAAYARIEEEQRIADSENITETTEATDG